MTSGISGPGGSGGPAGPGGPTGPDGPDAAAGADGAGEVSPAGAALTAEVERLRAAQGPGPAQAVDDLSRLAADLDAGRVSGDEALVQLIAQMGVELGDLDGAELRALIADLVATDPYLGELAARLGATPGGGAGGAGGDG
jgi:hypothetical protein